MEKPLFLIQLNLLFTSSMMLNFSQNPRGQQNTQFLDLQLWNQRRMHLHRNFEVILGNSGINMTFFR